MDTEPTTRTEATDTHSPAGLDNLPELLTVAEVAPVLRMKTSTAYAAIKRGAFPVPVVRLGGRMLISRYRLADWLRSAGE
jgi:excisionase family DNA binding protein